MNRKNQQTFNDTPSASGQRPEIERLISSRFSKLQPYDSITPPEASGISIEDSIKLDGNENPYGCSPKVQRALARFAQYHIYPDPEQRELRGGLAKYANVSPECIIVGSGSDELIDLLLRLFVERGDKVINCVPTFGMYQFCAEQYGAEVLSIPRTANFALDVTRIEKAVDNRTKLVFIASPNNPTGNTATHEDISKIASIGPIVVVDEAYHEFSKVTTLPLRTQYENLLVLRTFSKWAGLAGLRVGYGIFPEQIVRLIDKIKQPYNVNAAGLIAASESLKDIKYLQGTIQSIIEERGHMFNALSELEFLSPIPSEANFILCDVLRGNAKEVYTKLKQQGIFIRYFDTPLLNNYIRISVGKPEHTQRLIKALQDMDEKAN